MKTRVDRYGYLAMLAAVLLSVAVGWFIADGLLLASRIYFVVQIKAE